jgi:predicted nuclease with RNAse H fold
MKIVGIDLSGPRNFAETCLVSFEERGKQLHLLDVLDGATDEQILQATKNLGNKERIILGIDAPLSYHSTGGDRPADKALRDLIREKGGGAGIMPPTMTKMVYLTLRGINLSRLLELFKPEYDLGIVEVHPGACLLLRGAEKEDVRKFKSDRPACERLLNWLEEHGVKGVGSVETNSDHYVAACAAALGAWSWGLGISKWKFEAIPPHHPYDFAC